MKKVIFITLAIIAIASISCTDYTDPKVLSGTTWRCSSFPSDYSNTWEYIDLQFISTSQVEAWQKPKDGNLYKSGSAASYIISNKTITISSGYSENITGVIENNKMTMVITGVTLIFTKQ